MTTVSFDVSGDVLKFHANSTHEFQAIMPHIHSLSRTLKRPEVREIDLSFALSNIDADDIKEMIPKKLGNLRGAKLNFGNTDIGVEGAQYLVDNLPSSLESLDLSLDAIDGG